MSRAPSAPTRSFVAGDTVQWAVAGGRVPDYPAAAGWAYGVRLVGLATLDGAVLVAPEGVLLVTFAASGTAALLPGTYRWTLYAERETGGAEGGYERGTVAAADVVVRANPMGALGDGSERPFPERMVALCEQLLLDVAADPLKEYALAGDVRKRWTLEEAQKAHAYWRAQAQLRRLGGRLPAVKVAFVR